jgi:hypothetical protein
MIEDGEGKKRIRIEGQRKKTERKKRRGKEKRKKSTLTIGFQLPDFCTDNRRIRGDYIYSLWSNSDC